MSKIIASISIKKYNAKVVVFGLCNYIPSDMTYSIVHSTTPTREKIKMEINFAGKRALVTGAGKGRFLFNIFTMFL